jgi:hypothetical protein
MASAIPETVPEVEADKCYAAPSPPPGPWAEHIRQSLDPRLFEIYTANRVPWQILKTMADDGWTDIGSVSARFLTAEAVHARAPESLHLTSWGPKQQEIALARLIAAQEDLSLHKQHRQKLKTNPRVSQVVEDTDRKTMGAAFTETTKEACPLANQGSKHLLGKMNKAASEGRIEDLTNNEIVPYLPHPDTKTRSETRVNHDGTQEEFQKEWRNAPTQAQGWKQQMRIYYTTLMMVLCVHKEHTKLEIGWDQLKDFYEEFLFGNTIMKRNNPPSLVRLMIAERRAWQAVITLMWEKDMRLDAALHKVQSNVLWWTNELEIKRDSTPHTKGAPKGDQHRPPSSPGKGKGHYQSSPKKAINSALKPNTSPPHGGKGTKSNKGKGNNDLAKRSAKRALPHGLADGMRVPPDQWGQPPHRQEWCNNFHSGRPCSGNCGRDHTCPGCRKGSHPLTECRNI